MKRCPTCNRAENNDALTFCRVDGATLDTDPSVADESSETRILPASRTGEPQGLHTDTAQSSGPTTGLEATKSRLQTGELKAAGTVPRPRESAVAARSHRWAVVTALVLVIAAAVFSYFYFGRGSKATIDSIAVLPFVNVSKDPNSEYLSDGVTESIISSLSQLPQLRVMARSTVFRFKGRETEPQAVGKELGVRAVLVGRMLQQGENLTVSTELVNVSDGTQLWGEQYNRKMSDLVTVQQEIAREISERLRLKLTGAQQRQLAKGSTENTEAYQHYLKGRYHQNRASEEGYKKSIDYYQQAIAIDPNYAQAYAGIADAYSLAADWYLSDREAYEKAKAAATRALEIDDTLAESHVSMAIVGLFYDWNWAEAEKEYKRALELKPNYADAHIQYCFYLWAIRRQYPEAIAEAKQAVQLDPLSLPANGALADALTLARQYDQAIEQLRKTLELDPNVWFTHHQLGVVYEYKGQLPEEIAEFQKAMQLDNNPMILAKLARAYALSGKRGEAQKLIDQLKDLSRQRYVSSGAVAEIYAALGERDQTFELLEKGYDERAVEMLFLKNDPIWDGFRSDPRFQDLLRRVGLPQ